MNEKTNHVGTRGSALGVDGPVRETEINRELNKLEFTIENLIGSVQYLSKKVAPVVREISKNSVDKEMNVEVSDDPCNTAIGARISSSRRIVQDLRNSVESLTNLIEL